jgi:hydrogenase maturation protease
MDTTFPTNERKRFAVAFKDSPCDHGLLEGAPSVRIIAVGSSHGDDQAGWRISERLQRKPQPGVDAIAVSDPVCVLDHLEGCAALVLVDACHSGAPAGTIHRLVWPNPQMRAPESASTHGFGVAGVLELAATLGRLPPHVVLLGVEAQACAPAAEMSPSVRRAVPALYRQVLAEARRQTLERPRRERDVSRSRSEKGEQADE